MFTCLQPAIEPLSLRNTYRLTKAAMWVNKHASCMLETLSQCSLNFHYVQIITDAP